MMAASASPRWPRAAWWVVAVLLALVCVAAGLLGGRGGSAGAEGFVELVDSGRTFFCGENDKYDWDNCGGKKARAELEKKVADLQVAVKTAASTKAQGALSGDTSVIGGDYGASRFTMRPSGVGAGWYTALQADDVMDGYKKPRPLLLNPDGGQIGIGQVPKGDRNYYPLRKTLNVMGESEFVAGNFGVSRFTIRPSGVGAGWYTALEADDVMDGYKQPRPLILNPNGGPVGIGKLPLGSPNDPRNYYAITDALRVAGTARVDGSICIKSTCIDEAQLAKLAKM